MADVQTVQQSPIWPELQASFGNWLNNQFYQYNGWQEAFPSELNVGLSDTMLPAIWGSWNPNGGSGQNFLSSYLGGTGYQMDPRINQAFQTALEWGGPAGQGTKYMNNIAQWGGTGGLGNSGMTNAANTGTPTGAGNPVLDMSKAGGSGEWGRALASRAYGGPSAAQLALQQFLTAPVRKQATFQAPTPFTGR